MQPMLAALPLQDGSLMPRPPDILVEMATMGADYTWPVVLLGMAAVVMLILSARRGVRAFSIALNYSNLWFVFGKRRWVTVRVHSFTSSDGFLTTSGEFSAELVKEDEEDETEFDLVGPSSKSPIAATAGCILGTEMVVIYRNSSSVFQTGCLTADSFSGKFRARLPSELVRTSLMDERDSMLLPIFFARDAADSRMEDAGVYRFGRDDKVESSLLESLNARSELSRVRVVSKNAWPVLGDYQWDAKLKLRLIALNSIPTPFRGQEPSLTSAIVRGPVHTATLRKNVVRVWDNATRSIVMSLPLRNDDISSLDVDWENETALLGSRSGVLSLWDIKRMTSVSSFSSQVESAILYSHASPNSVNDKWAVTRARSSFSEESALISLWDSRTCCRVATTSVKSSQRHDLKLEGFELVVRDSLGKVSMHDVRMLPESRTSTLSRGKIELSTSQKHKFDDSWLADSNDDLDLLFKEENDFPEDSWVRVDSEESTDDSTSISPSPSPGLLSRCFRAISSVLAK